MAQVELTPKTAQSSGPSAPQPIPETPQAPPPSSSSVYTYVISAVAIFLLLAIVTALIYVQVSTQRNSQDATIIAPSLEATPTSASTSTPTPTRKSTPTPYPLPQGKETFVGSYGPGTKGPKINSITLDPYDPKVGESQAYVVEISSAEPVTSVDLALTTDTRTTTYPLQKTTSTDKTSTWSVKITTNDTHFYIYNPNFTARTATEQSVSGLTLRAY